MILGRRYSPASALSATNTAIPSACTTSTTPTMRTAAASAIPYGAPPASWTTATTTTTATDYTTETEYDSDVTDSTTTFDNPVYRNATKNAHGGKDTTTLNGEIENAESGTDTITDTRLKADNVVSESGRNGTSLTDEVVKEVNFRLSKDLSDSIIEGFIKKYLFILPYGMGCTDWN